MIARNLASLERRRNRSRRGAALVEAAISLSVLLTFLIFLLDFSIAAFRSEALNYLADRVARTAAVHGPKALSSHDGGPWGPITVTTTLSGSGTIANIARRHGTGLPSDEVTLTVTWPSASNAAGEPVVVTAEMPWTPSLLRPMTMSILTLRGVSRQIIVH
ncbi:hypothetical protein GC170_15875 [bacterium]|nr:hypothetical protein [bacterium]